MYLVKARANTIIKAVPEQSALLTPDQKIAFPIGQDVAVLNYGDIEQSRNHVRVCFDMASLPSDRDSVAAAIAQTKQATWYLWPDHVEISGTDPNNKPRDLNSSQPGRSKDPAMDYEFRLPGFNSIFNMANPIIKDGRMFWYEALHFDPGTRSYRPPEDTVVVSKIVALAEQIEGLIRPTIKQRFGIDSIICNSWYRDPATNAAVGGSTQSRHMWGDAIDFVVPGISPYDVNDILEPSANGGLASASVFTHWDERGYLARWSYGF